MTPRPSRRALVAAGASGALGWVLLVGLVLLAFAQLPTVLWQDVVVAKLLVVRFLTVALLLGIGLVYLGGNRRPRVSPHFVFGVLFLVWALVSTVLSQNRHLSLFGAVFRYEGWLGFASYFTVFWAAGLVASKGSRPGRAATPVLIAGVLLISLLAVIQHFWPPSRSVAVLVLGDWDQRSFATFGNPIFLGLFGSLAGPLLLGVVASTRHRPTRLVALSALVLVMVATVFTYSRASWVGLVAGMLMAGALIYGRRRAGWALVLGLLVVSFALPAVVDKLKQPATSEASVAGRVTATLQGGGSLASRFELYKTTLPLIGERPVLGWGFEAYTAEAARVRTEKLIQTEGPRAFADRPHNSLLYVAFSTGVVGLLLYLLFLGSAFRAVFANYRGARGGGSRLLLAGALGGALGYFVAELGSFSVVEVTPLAWAVLGWAAAAGRSSPAVPESPRAGGRLALWGDRLRARFRMTHRAAQRGRDGQGFVLKRALRGRRACVALGGVVLLAAAVTAPFSLGHAVDVARANRIHYRNVSAEYDLRDYRRLAADEEKAAGLDPHNPYVWNVLGSIYLDVGVATRDDGLIEEARQAFTRGLGYIRQDPSLTVSLSDLEIKAGRPQEAAALLEAYLRWDPFLEDARFNLGLAYLALDRPADAAAQLERAVGLVPSDAEAFWYLAKAHEAAGDPLAAEAARSRALSLDPSLARGS